MRGFVAQKKSATTSCRTHRNLFFPTWVQVNVCVCEKYSQEADFVSILGKAFLMSTEDMEAHLSKEI